MQPNSIPNNIRVPYMPELDDGQEVEGGELISSSEIFERCKHVILDAFSSQDDIPNLDLHEIREIFPNCNEAEFSAALPKLEKELYIELNLDEEKKTRLMEELRHLRESVLQQEVGEPKELVSDLDFDDEINGKLYPDVSEVEESQEGEQQTVQSTAITVHGVSASTLVPHYTPIIPTSVVIYRFHEAFLCLDSNAAISFFTPELETKVQQIVPPYPTFYTPAQKKYVVWNGRGGELRLVPVENLITAWRKNRPEIAFVSTNNRPKLLEEALDTLAGSNNPLVTAESFVIVGYLDSHSRSTNRLEALMLNQYKVNIPSDYPVHLCAPQTPGAPAPTAAASSTLQRTEPKKGWFPCVLI